MTERKRLPNRRASIIFSFEFETHRYRATISRFDDGGIAELFLDVGKFGSGLQHHASSAAILASMLLQHRVAPGEIARSVGGAVGLALSYFSKSQAVI